MLESNTCICIYIKYVCIYVYASVNIHMQIYTCILYMHTYVNIYLILE